MPNITTIHQYYFTQTTGCLFGLIPNTSNVIKVEPPFLSFNPKTRILASKSGLFYLPTNQAELSKKPDLFSYTGGVLMSLV